MISAQLLQDITTIWTTARTQAVTLVNRALIEAYWAIGQRITEAEQDGAQRAGYGRHLLRDLAARLTAELDKNLDERELRRIRQFYQAFPIRDALRPELTWTHYRLLLRVENADARDWYAGECAAQHWGTRQLERNIQSRYFDRHRVHPVAPLSDSPTSAMDLIKDPYLFDFLGLEARHGMSENDLESALLSKLHDFLLELGKGFAFVGRQHHIKTDTRSYFIDLVFYNYLLKCFVLVDLKITELTHQDIGQMDMYVRMFEELRKIPGDNPTVGIILCADKDDTLVKFSMLNESAHLFASRYRFILPSESELSQAIDDQREIFQQRLR